jgi:hypothetical protein
MLDSEATNIAALESCIGKTPGRCIFRIVLAQPRAAIAVFDSDAQNACLSCAGLDRRLANSASSAGGISCR